MALRDLGRGDEEAAVDDDYANNGSITAEDTVGHSGSGPIRLTNSPNRFNTLPEDLFVEILQRLPSKLANRCKCVSKRWLNSISNPYFALRFTRYRSSLAPPSALFFHYKPSTNWVLPPRQVHLALLSSSSSVENPQIFTSRGFSLNFLPSSEPVQFLASHNGLVLCCATPIFQKVYYVCNLPTMRFIALPPPPTCHKDVRVALVCRTLCDDNEDLTMMTRFRVVRITEFESKGRLFASIKLEIFLSETGLWTDCVHSSDQPCFGFGYTSAVVCNGILHWYDVCRGGIFAYDPFTTANEYRTIGLPKVDQKIAEDNKNGGCTSKLGECKGRLRLAKYHYLAGTFSIWELKDYRIGEWFLLHRFHKIQIVSEDCQLVKYITHSNQFMTILGFHPVDRDVMYLRFIGCIIECNIRSRGLKPFCSLASPKVFILQWMAFPYSLPWWPTPVP